MPDAPRPRSAAAPYVFLGAAVLLVFANMFANDWTHYDDHAITQTRYQVRAWSVENLRIIWTPRGNYVPLRDMFYLVDATVFGPGIRGYLATNFLWHLVGVWAFFCLVRRQWQDASVAFVAALLFAVHPLRAEPVAWVAGSKDLMCFAFSVCATLAYVRAREGGRGARRLWCAAGALTLLALGSKLTALALPIVFAAVELCDADRTVELRRRVLRWLPFAVVTGLWFVLAVGPARTRVLDLFGLGLPAVEQRRIVTAAAEQRAEYYWPSLRAMVLVTWRYVALWVWPSRLAALYAVPLEPSWLRPPVLAGLLGLGAGLGGTVWLWLRGARRPVFWIIWAIAFYLPVSNLMPVAALMNDRYIHIPSAAGSVLLAAGLVALVRRAGGGGRAARAAIVLLAGALAVRTVVQVTMWRSPRALWERTNRAEPGNPRIQISLAALPLFEGRPDDAIRALSALEAEAPDNFRRLQLLGQSYLAARRTGAAAATYERALELYPIEARFLLGLATARSEQGRHAEALAHARAVLTRSPHHVKAKLVAGFSLARLGRVAEALVEFAAARDSAPNAAMVAQTAARALIETDRPDTALSYARQWYQIEPGPVAGQVYARALYAAGGATNSFELLLKDLNAKWPDDKTLQQLRLDIQRDSGADERPNGS